MLNLLIAPAAGFLLCCAGSAATAAPTWQLAGTTYNSVAFVDVASVVFDGTNKYFTSLRVSGQPAKDGWSSVVQKLAVDCHAGVFTDKGTIIEQADRTFKKYPASDAHQKAGQTGVFGGMFEILCRDRPGRTVTNPKAWTVKNFRVGS